MIPVDIQMMNDRELMAKQKQRIMASDNNLIKNNKFNIYQYLDNKGQNLSEVEGILSLIVDKQCINDEEGMRELISLLQKNKSKIQGIVISDFEGAFKVDYLKRIELTLRDVQKLRLIVIHNSNLTREHIQILRNIIWWRRNQLEKIFLNKNSIDSFDFKNLFVSSDFNFTDLINLKMLEIRVQPGINKLTKNQFNEFTNLIAKSNNIQKTSNKSKEGLYIALDETSLNNKNRKLLRQSSDTLSSIHLEDTNTERLFYQLCLGGCFSDKNEAGLRYLGESLIGENFDDIIQLSMKKTNLKTLENWFPIFSFLKRTKTILKLDLSSCSLNDKVINILFSHQFNIKQIDLSDNNSIQLNGWKKIIESVICNPNSITDIIKLNNCYFKDSEIVQIGNIIQSFSDKMNKNNYTSPLLKLYFNQNPQISAQAWSKLLNGLFQLTKNNLETIELRECDFDDEKILVLNQAINTAYEKGGQLEEIVLRNNPKIGNSAGISSLFETVFKKLNNFKKVDLSSCNISNTNMTNILNHYKTSNLILEQIIIKNNQNIGEESYKLLAELMIFTDHSLVNKIDMSNNQITKQRCQGLLEIGKQFEASGRKNTKLKKIILNQNSRMEDETFKELVDLLLFNNKSTHLTKISLKNTLNAEKCRIIVSKMKELDLQKESLTLQHICFDKNIISQTDPLVQLIDTIMLSSLACPSLEILSFSYCNLLNTHIKELLQCFKNNKPSPNNLKKLNLKGNVSLTSDGWLMISFILFQSGVFKCLESLDMSYCKLEETSISSICLIYSSSSKNKSEYYKYPLKELILQDNPQINSDDWKFIFDTIVFSKHSNIKSLNASNSGFDSTAMNIRTFKKELANQGFFDERERHQLVNLNIEQNEGIDELSWKEFISVYILNKLKENAFDENYKQQLKNQQADIIKVKESFSEIEKKYRDKLHKLNIINKQPIFQVKYLDLKGTSSLDQNQWLDLFTLLIVNDRSQIEFLGLSQTFIEKSGWDQIQKLINEYVGKNQQLNIKRIQFNDNQYLHDGLWVQICKGFFFNSQLLSLKSLELESCKINQNILKTILGSITTLIDLEVLKMKRNLDIDCIQVLEKNELNKLRVLECDKIDIPTEEQKKENITQMRYSLQEINVKLLDHNPQFQIESLCAIIPSLKVLHVQGTFVDFNNQYKSIIEYTSTRLNSFTIRNQNLDSVSLFPSIVHVNAYGTTLKHLDLHGSVMDKLSKEQMDKKKFERENNVLIHHNPKTEEEEKTEEVKERERIQKVQSQRSSWEIILNQGYLNSDNKKLNMNLVSLNLSGTMGQQESSTPRDCSTIEYILKYVARHCSSLTNLNISNCFMSEAAFQSFCVEYQKNASISITDLNVSNNQHLKTESWKCFFEKVVFQKKSKFDFLNLSKNMILKEEFEIMRSLSSKFNSNNFVIKKLYMKNLQKSVEASVWVQLFFIEFIKIQNRKIEKIYLHDSLSLESQNAISEFLQIYLLNSNCNIKCIYGYDEISQIFKQVFPLRQYTLNLKKELKTNSQFVVIDMWKQALVKENAMKIKCENQLTEEFVSGIPHMNLDLILDFLQPMDMQFSKILNQKVGQINVSTIEKTTEILCFDYETIKLMSKYFNEKQNQDNNNSLVNPQTFILNQKLQQFLANPTIFKKIFFIQHKFFDAIDTQQISELFFQFKESKIDSIIIDYDLRQVDLGENFSERRLINLIRLFPPKSLELTNVSINALKAIYSIISSNENFRYANVNFSSQSFINNGIAFSLREQLYMGKKRKNWIMKFLNSIAYSFLNIFCTEAEVYKFDKTIPILNENLTKTRKYFNAMIILTIIYYGICIFCPYYLTVYFGVYVKTKSGVAWQSHYVYLGFAVLSCIIEVLIYKFAYQQIKHLLPKLIDIDNIDSEETSIGGKVKMFFKKRIGLLEWISYMISLVLSQFDRFDLYSDVCFIVICMKMEEYIIGFISLAVIANQLFTNICKLFYFLYSIFVKDQRRMLNTNEINSFCELSNLIEFEALNNILDTVAPYNISFIPNTWLFKLIMPSVAGQSISNRLLVSMQKFIFEDVFQIILQLAFVIASKESDSTVIISIVMSFISLTKAFYKFMSIRPSTISQLDFDSLSKTKRQHIEQYGQKLKDYRNNMLENLKQTIDNYSPVISVDINNKYPKPESQPLISNQKQ